MEHMSRRVNHVNYSWITAGVQPAHVTQAKELNREKKQFITDPLIAYKVNQHILEQKCRGR